MTTVQPQNDHDIFRFPCGTMCYRFEAQHYAQLGHDYEVHPVGSPEYGALQAEKATIRAPLPATAESIRSDIADQRPEWAAVLRPRPVYGPGTTVTGLPDGNVRVEGEAPTCPEMRGLPCSFLRTCFLSGCVHPSAGASLDTSEREAL